MERDPLDRPGCGRELDHYLYESFSRILRQKFINCQNFKQILSRLDQTIRFGIHMTNVERPTPQNYERKNENLRVSYLMNEITEKEMRDILQKDDKKHHKDQELFDIYTLLCTTVTDILYRFLDQLKNDQITIAVTSIDSNILYEIDRIVEYANECLLDISHTYSCSRVIVEQNLQILRGQRVVEYFRKKREDQSIKVENEILFGSSSTSMITSTSTDNIKNEFI